MSENLLENIIEQSLSDVPPVVQEETHTAVKFGEVVNMGIMDQASIEIVNMGNNDHYMLMVNATATPKTIEPELLKLANLPSNEMIFLIFQSRIVGEGEYLNALISDDNNTFYMLYKAKELGGTHTPTEETSRFLYYDSKITTLNSEITNVKVELANAQSYIRELENTLRQNSIPLPEELKAMKQKEEERQLHMKEEEEKEVVKETAYLKWTDKGPQGIQNLISEINRFSYTNLEVLDLTDLHMGDEGCLLLAKAFSQGWSLVNVFQFYFSPTTLPRLHSILLYGNDIGPTGANALLSAFKYLPQVELLGLEVLRRRLSAKEVDIFNHLQLDRILFTSTTLDLSNLRLVDNFLVQFCGYVDYLITGDKTTIRKLYFNKNKFKSRGTMKLASLIAASNLPNLEVLDLEDNEIDEEAALFIATCISEKTTPCMSELYLGGNYIGDKGVSTLFRYFKKSSINSITQLSLQRVHMGYEGIRFISNSVLFNTMKNLKFLNIAGNAIGSKGLIIIVKSLEREGFPKLEHLNVNENKIKDDGCEYLLNAIDRCKLGVLRHIDMALNGISKEMEDTVQQVLSRQNDLTISFMVQQRM